MTRASSRLLQERLAALIAETPAGKRLPSEPELARQLGVSRATLREAMRAFEVQGLIHRRQGSGTFVSARAPILEAGLEVLESLEKTARRFGLQIQVRNLEIERILADDTARQMLSLPANAEVTRVRRVIWIADHPVAYLVDTLPLDVLRPEDFPETFGGSVLDFLLERGEELAVSKASISATLADAEIARVLRIQRHDVLLLFTSQLFRQDGRVIDYSISAFIPGYFHFHILRRIAKSE
ncbi:MAG: GntR family transcriptional regulator [Anaerolineales bacterium]